MVVKYNQEQHAEVRKGKASRPLKKLGRKKRKGHYNRGSYVSTKTNQTCKHRSGWELMYMQWLDADKDVLTWSYEQTVIPYVSNVKSGKQRRYYPDFLVERTDGTRQLVEVKPARKLHQRIVAKKLLAAGDWCRANGVTLVVITEVELKALCLLK